MPLPLSGRGHRRIVVSSVIAAVVVRPIPVTIAASGAAVAARPAEERVRAASVGLVAVAAVIPAVAALLAGAVIRRSRLSHLAITQIGYNKTKPRSAF